MNESSELLIRISNIIIYIIIIIQRLIKQTYKLRIGSRE